MTPSTNCASSNARRAYRLRHQLFVRGDRSNLRVPRRNSRKPSLSRTLAACRGTVRETWPRCDIMRSSWARSFVPSLLPEASESEVRAAGCGVIVDAPQGLVVTNNHVMEHADEIAVTLTYGQRGYGHCGRQNFGRQSDCPLGNADGSRSAPIGTPIWILERQLPPREFQVPRA